MGDQQQQDCLSLADNAGGTRILTINGQTIMVNGLKMDSMAGGTDLFSVLQNSGETPLSGREEEPLQLAEEGGFLLYLDNEASELQSMQMTAEQAAALGLDTVLDEPPPLTIDQEALDKAIKPVTFSIRLQTNAPKVRPPPLQIVSGPVVPPPGKVAIPRPTEEARIIRTNANCAVRSNKVIPRILATPTTGGLPPAPPLVPFSKSVLKVI